MKSRANFLQEFSRPHQTTMIDLHGLSVAQAQSHVTHHINQASISGYDKIRFVTGRGNHINARGERGTLYNNFKDWIKAVRGNIENIEQYDGYYEIDMKNETAVRNPFMAFMSEAVKHSIQQNIDEIKNLASQGHVEYMTALASCYDAGI